MNTIMMTMTSPGLVCTFYSTLGGIKAVLMTDVFQSLLMFAAIFSVIGKYFVGSVYKWRKNMYFTACTCIDADGVTPILDTAWARGRIEFFNLSPDPTVRHTLWTQVIIIDQHHDDINLSPDGGRLLRLLLPVRREPGPGPEAALPALPGSGPGSPLDSGINSHHLYTASNNAH